MLDKIQEPATLNSPFLLFLSALYSTVYNVHVYLGFMSSVHDIS